MPLSKHHEFRVYERTGQDNILATQYVQLNGLAKFSGDGTKIVLACEDRMETWHDGFPQPGNSYYDSRVIVRSGSNWQTETRLYHTPAETTAIATDSRHRGDHASPQLAVSDNGSVIVLGRPCWPSDGPNYYFDRITGQVIIYYGSSWASRKLLRDGQQRVVYYGFPDNHSFGASVAVSADGSVVVVGEPEWYHYFVNPDQVAVWGWYENVGRIHVYSGANYGTHTIITNPDWAGTNAYPGLFGSKVAISADGSTIFASAPDPRSSSRARVYKFGGSGWSTVSYVQQGNPALADEFGGTGLACSDDGSKLFVGAFDKLYAYSGASLGTETILAGAVARDGIDCSPDGSVVVASGTDPTGVGQMNGWFRKYEGTLWATTDDSASPSYGWALPFYPYPNTDNTTRRVETFFGHSPSIGLGNRVLVALNVTTIYSDYSNLWYDEVVEVHLYSYGLTAKSVLRSSQAKSFTAKAVRRKKDNLGSFAIEAEISMPFIRVVSIIKKNQTVSGTADAILMPRFFINAIKLKTQVKTLMAGAYFVNPYWVKHDRGNSAHYDLDLDTVITLAGALGIHPSGTDLHSVLTDLNDRISSLENSPSL